MSFSNWNLLPAVLRQIPKSPFEYRKPTGTTVNEFGQAMSGYGPWQTGFGSVQPGGAQNEHTVGIDFTKETVTVWAYGVRLVSTLDQSTPDQIRYQGKIYNVVSTTMWNDFDNFCQCTCQRVFNENGGQMRS